MLDTTWLDILPPDWKNRILFSGNVSAHVKTINSKIDSHLSDASKEKFINKLKVQFKGGFQNIGKVCIRGVKAEIKIKGNSLPIFHRAYSVPYALLKKVEKELNKLKEQGVTTLVKNSNSCSPIVLVPKKNDDLRICVDFKVTINNIIEKDVYPLPNREDFFATLLGKNISTVLDLSRAYQQVEISETSRKYFTINTHLGLFLHNRLTYGISSAPMIFQTIMDKILNGLN